MTLEPREVVTRLATLRHALPGLLEIHYHAGGVFVNEDILEVQEMRRKMMGDRVYATLTIIPEDVDFTLDPMRVDHAGADRLAGRIVASAIVAKASVIERLTRVYLKYYPQLQRIFLTHDEEAARVWIMAQLKELSDTGS